MSHVLSFSRSERDVDALRARVAALPLAARQINLIRLHLGRVVALQTEWSAWRVARPASRPFRRAFATVDRELADALTMLETSRLFLRGVVVGEGAAA